MRALIIEDDSAQAALSLAALNRIDCLCEVADNGEDGLELLKTKCFDLAIIDVVLPRMDGLSVIRQAREAGIDTPIIVLSAKGSPDDFVDGYAANADMYIAKPCVMEVLQGHVKALMRRIVRMSAGDVICHAGISLNWRTKQVVKDGCDIPLSVYEFNLLELLLSNHGTFIAYERIKKEVWSGRPSVTVHNLQQSVEGLRFKLGDRDKSNPIIYNKRGVGYVIR